MAMLYKSDVNPGGPVLSYEDLARLFQRAETGRDAAAAIAFARLPDAEKRLARGLVSAFTSKADSAPQPAWPCRCTTLILPSGRWRGGCAAGRPAREPQERRGEAPG